MCSSSSESIPSDDLSSRSFLRSNVRVLLVDDAPINLVIASRLLEDAGGQIVTASSGEEALEAIERERVDIVLLDLQMPGIDGYEVARRIRARPNLRDLPVIAVSANATAEHRDRAEAAGMSAYVEKPFREEELIAAIGDCLGRASKWRRVEIDPSPAPPRRARSRRRARGGASYVEIAHFSRACSSLSNGNSAIWSQRAIGRAGRSRRKERPCIG